VKRTTGSKMADTGTASGTPELRQQIREAVDAVRRVTDCVPEVAIVLGTGLGGLAAHIEKTASCEYGTLPHFPVPTVATHEGTLVFGRLSGKNVVAMQGRFHYYEGYSMQQITFPVRVVRALGAETLIVSNAAGGLNPQFRAGDMMLITDHINLMGDNPLIGPNDDELGPRYPDMSEPYSRKLVDLAETIAVEQAQKVQRGVYVAVSGPNLETAAEYRFLRYIGADAVGMSTVPEVIVAVHAGLKVFGVSAITDECLPDALKPADIDEIVRIAADIEPRLTRLVSELVGQMR
jgi:purine-nucleoside phosphorylase